MKTILLFFVSVTLLISCGKKESNQNPQKTIITGRIDNFKTVSNHDMIEIIYEDLLAGERRIYQSIDENGLFRFELDLNHPMDFNLKYSGFLTYHISPGDSLNFTINSDCWRKKSRSYKDENKFYLISGTSKELNNDISKFLNLYKDSLCNMEADVDSSHQLEPMDYLNFKTRQLIDIEKSLTKFNKEENTSKEFRQWSANHIKYDNWTRLMFYRFNHAWGNNEDAVTYVQKMPKEYFSFLDEMKYTRGNELNNSAYLNFLNEYDMYVYQVIPADSSKLYLSQFETAPEKAGSYLLRYYQSTHKGFLKDVLIAKFYYRILDKKGYPDLKNIYNVDIIHDQELRESIQQKYNYEQNLFENPELSVKSKINELKDENDFLQALIKKYPGKVIYMDFWAPWCGPCMADLPNSQNLVQQYEGKNVAFIFLASNCKEASWKATIAEQKIEGEHYLLTKKQFAQLSSIFNIQGIPHYALIDTKGNIVNGDAPHPGENEKLIKLIENHLN